MTNRKTTRRALVLSLLSLLLCCSMLVGTTFAWFTDSVTSGKNQIVAGNLDVELYYQVEGQTDWTKVTDNSNVFKENTLWEPGHTEVVKLKVVNEGTLSLKYQLGVNIVSETGSKNVLGNEFKLSDYIKFGVVEGAQTYNREQAIAAVEANATALNVAYGTGTVKLDPKTETNTDNEDIVTMVVYMPTSVDNNANYAKGEAVPTILLGLNLYATQVEAEDDSFGTDYDKDAWGKEFKVYTAEDLQTAIDAGETNITLMDDITLDTAIVIPASASTYSLRASGITINMNGKSITIEAAYDDSNAKASSALVNNGVVTLVGEGEIKALNNYTVRNYGTMVIDGITVANGIMNFADLTVESGNISNSRTGKHTIYGNNAKLTLNGGRFHNDNPGNATIFAYAGEVIMNGGEYTIADGTATLGWTSCLLDAQGNAKYTINGGTVKGEIRDYNKNTTVYGGTFTHNSVKNFVADGYKAVASNGNYIVVSADAITTTDELVAAINDGKNAGKTDIKLAPGEYDLRFTNNTSFNVDDITIKGIGEVKLAISSSEAWYGRVQGSNVTFENIHFTGDVGATGKATYNDCTFDSWAICASGNEKTYYNNCTINGCLNTSTDFSSDDVFVKDSEIVKAEYSGSMTMNFENCQIGELIIWNANTNLNDCEVTTLDKSNVTTAIIRIDGIYETEKPIENAQPAPYKGELYDEGTNAVSYKDMELTGDAYISIDNNASVAVENVKADVNGSVIVMKDYQPAIYIYGSEFTIGEGEYLIDASAVDGGVYQIFLVNVKVNGEYLTQETAAQYLNNVKWFQALQATNP